MVISAHGIQEYLHARYVKYPRRQSTIGRTDSVLVLVINMDIAMLNERDLCSLSEHTLKCLQEDVLRVIAFQSHISSIVANDNI